MLLPLSSRKETWKSAESLSARLQLWTPAHLNKIIILLSYFVEKGQTWKERQNLHKVVKKNLLFVPSAKYPYWLFEVKRVLMFYWPELDSLEWNCQISTVKAVSQFGIRAWQLTPIKVENSNCSPQQSMCLWTLNRYTNIFCYAHLAASN